MNKEVQTDLFTKPVAQLERLRDIRLAATAHLSDRNERELRVITLTEPWATLMRLRAKRLETRGGAFPRNYRGECAVQASKGWKKDERELCSIDPFYTVLFSRLRRELGFESNDDRLSRANIHKLLLPTLGHVIALGEIAATFWTDGLMQDNATLHAQWCQGRASAGMKLNPQPIEEDFGNYGEGRLALEFRKMRGLEAPIPVTGNLGLWKASPVLATRIRAAALDFEAELARASHRASGEVVCELCARTLIDHPPETEILSDLNRPFLVRGCNGDLLKL